MNKHHPALTHVAELFCRPMSNYPNALNNIDKELKMTRAAVLIRLRQWGQWITPIGLATWMDASPSRISSTLSELYYMDKVDRRITRPYVRRYQYKAKDLQS